MDIIAKYPTKDIMTIAQDTMAVFAPLVKHDEIARIPTKIFSYGSDPRHQLNVFYPTPRGDSTKPPLLNYIFGGPLSYGERSAYANVGAFFATQGFVTVVADRRLLPVTWPDVPTDVTAVLSWSLEHLAGDADVSKLFVVAHSAGAMHIGTAFALPEVMPDALLQRIAAVVFVGPALELSTTGPMADDVRKYCGSFEKAREVDPGALLKKVSKERAAAWPAIRFVIPENEDLAVMGDHDGYIATLKDKGIRIDHGEAKGHNHASVVLCLFTGQGEEWAVESAEWFKTF